MKQAIRVTGYNRCVNEWGPDGEGKSLFDTSFEYIDHEAETIEEIDAWLGLHSLPNLREWGYYDGWAGDGSPRYETELIENRHGAPDPDGKLIARYSIIVELLTIEHYIIGEKRV